MKEDDSPNTTDFEDPSLWNAVMKDQKQELLVEEPIRTHESMLASRTSRRDLLLPLSHKLANLQEQHATSKSFTQSGNLKSFARSNNSGGSSNISSSEFSFLQVPDIDKDLYVQFLPK